MSPLDPSLITPQANAGFEQQDPMTSFTPASWGQPYQADTLSPASLPIAQKATMPHKLSNSHLVADYGQKNNYTIHLDEHFANLWLSYCCEFH